MDSIQRHMMEQTNKEYSSIRKDLRNLFKATKKVIQELAQKELQMILNDPSKFMVENYDRGGKVYYTFKLECSNAAATKAYFHLYEKYCEKEALRRSCANDEAFKAKCYVDAIKFIQAIYAHSISKFCSKSMAEFDWHVELKFNTPEKNLIDKDSFQNSVAFRSHKSDLELDVVDVSDVVHVETTSQERSADATVGNFNRVRSAFYWLLLSVAALYVLGLLFVGGVQGGLWKFEDVLSQEFMDYVDSLDFSRLNTDDFWTGLEERFEVAKAWIRNLFTK